MWVETDTMLKDIVLAIEGSTNLFPAGWVVRLFTNNITPQRNSVVGDFTELTNVQVPGYAAVAPTWAGTPIRQADLSWQDDTGDAIFQATGAPPAPIVVYGWFATNAAGTVLLGAGLLNLPYTFTSIGDGVRLEGSINVNQPTGDNVDLVMDFVQE